MSDGSLRTSFARGTTPRDVSSFAVPLHWKAVEAKHFCYGSRLQREKVKGVNNLPHALLRSSFGGSED